MTAKTAETIPSQIEYYEYNGQPREEWPAWLRKAFTTHPVNKAGRIATAHFECGAPEWFRWYDEATFWRQYKQVTR